MFKEIKTFKPEDHFPQLMEIPQPPKELYLVGELTEPSEDIKYLTVVGSRRSSSYGREVCRQLISQLTGWPIIIVSGLALGIDALAHQSALKAGLTTYAFPGSGLSPEVIYPATNRHLAQEIVASGGALISEFSPDTRAARYTFPQRNRLMAGVAQAVLMIEAGQASGSSITTNLALDYNREVLAVPGPINSPTAYEPNELIKLGATPITSGQDILEALGFNVEKQQLKLDLKLNEIEEKIITQLKSNNLSFDELINRTELSAPELNAKLSELELKNLIYRQGELFIFRAN